MYQDWTTGIGGSCDVYDPPRSPWCADNFYLERQFPEMHTRHPSGVYPDNRLPNGPYADPAGAIIHAWRPGHWYTWMFEVDSYTGGNSTAHRSWSVEQGQNNVWGKVPVARESTATVKYLGQKLSANDCWAACNASQFKCNDFTFHQLDFPDKGFAGGCYTDLTGGWGPTAQPMVISGRGPHSDSNSSFTFGAGGNQGGEGNEGAGEWYIEGVKEEMDQENEFWYDDVKHQLHFIPNGTAPPTDVAIPTLANLIEICGSQAMPAKNISIVGAFSNSPLASLFQWLPRLCGMFDKPYALFHRGRVSHRPPLSRARTNFLSPFFSVCWRLPQAFASHPTAPRSWNRAQTRRGAIGPSSVWVPSSWKAQKTSRS